jgi:hypothetical protein
MNQDRVNLTPEIIKQALYRLGDLAFQQKRVIDLAVYGDSSVTIAYDLSVATKDVDAIFEKDKDFVRKATLKIASELSLQDDWLDVAVKEYASSDRKNYIIHFASYPSEQKTGLRVFVPTPEYFFAMKCIDIQVSASSKDIMDIMVIKNLIIVCEIQNLEAACDIVESYYPSKTIRTKVQYILEKIFSQPI